MARERLEGGACVGVAREGGRRGDGRGGSVGARFHQGWSVRNISAVCCHLHAVNRSLAINVPTHSL